MKTLLTTALVLFTFSSFYAQELEIICPESYGQECSLTPGQNTFYYDEPTVTGGCEPYEWETWTVDDGSDDTCESWFEEHWQITDACGTVVTCSATFGLVDTTPPQLLDLNGAGCTEYVWDDGDEAYFYAGFFPAEELNLVFEDCSSLVINDLSWDEIGHVDVLSYQGCGSMATIQFTLEDVCGNSQTFTETVEPFGVYCDDPNSCDYGTYGYLEITNDDIGAGGGCEHFFGDGCYLGNNGGGILDDNCECQVFGCTNAQACNFNSEATSDDGSCLVEYGCMDETASNYDSNAQCPDDCTFSTEVLEIICPEGYGQECNPSPGQNSFDYEQPTVIGGCEPYEWETWTVDDGSDDTCESWFEEHWQVTDACGTVVACSATFGLVDTTPPVLLSMEGADCSDYFWSESQQTYSMYNILHLFLVYEDCSDPAWDVSAPTFSVDVLSYNGCGTSAVLEFELGDVCGNTQTYTQTVEPFGVFCDDPNSCDYGTYGPNDSGYGCTVYHGDECLLENDLVGAIDNNCECQIFGCMDSEACNYNSEATADDGSCLLGFTGCMDELALNYDPNALCPEICLYETGDSNGDGQVTVVDLGVFLSSFGTSCPEDEYCFGDLNGDEFVTAADLALFITLIGL